MAGLSPMMLALVWSGAMVIVCAAATVAVLRAMPPAPVARFFAFLGIESIALVFLAVALMVNFALPGVIGLEPGDNRPFLVVAIAFALLVPGLLLTIVVVPLLRLRAAESGTRLSGFKPPRE